MRKQKPSPEALAAELPIDVLAREMSRRQKRSQTKEQRTEIARHAAIERWRKKSKEPS